MYKHRTIEEEFLKLTTQYPVITLTGPRQSGKTTLCRTLFPDYRYVSLEKPDLRRRIEADPNAFFDGLKENVIIDEVQRIPDLLSYIQVYVDEKQKPGQFILTGSAQFELLESITQSLAGRTALLTLLPFSFGEIYRKEDVTDIDQVLLKGFYPRIFDKQLVPEEAYAYYTNTYIERDVRTLLNVKDLGKFEIFLRLIAGRSGQMINFSSLAIEAGVNHNTASNWTTILEASYIVYRLKPHFKNLGKRLVKSPKIYVTDPGLISYLLEIRSSNHMKNHPLRGSIFETFVVSELLKQQYHANKRPNLYYFRDNTGHEIDLLYDFGNVLFPVEIKSGKTVTEDYFSNLRFYMKINPECKKGAVVYGGDATFREKNIWIIGYRDITAFEKLDYRAELPL